MGAALKLKVKVFRALALLLVGITVLFGAVASERAFGAAGGSSSSGAYNGCSGYFISSCLGSGWWYYNWGSGTNGDLNYDAYEASSDRHWVPYYSSYAVGGYISAECKDAGGYWRYGRVAGYSAWKWVDSPWSADAHWHYYTAGDQVGLFPMSQGIANGTKDYYGNWSTAKAAFDAAKQHDKDEGTKWTYDADGNEKFWNDSSDLSWFCAPDPNLKEYKLTVQAIWVPNPPSDPSSDPSDLDDNFQFGSDSTTVEDGSLATVSLDDADGDWNAWRYYCDWGTCSDTYTVSKLTRNKVVNAYYYAARKLTAYAVTTGGSYLNSGNEIDHYYAYYGDTASVDKTSIEGYDFVGWATSINNAKNGTYVTRTDASKSTYVSGSSSPKETYNVKSLTANTDVYAVYQIQNRSLTLKAVDSNGNSLDSSCQVATVNYGTRAEVYEGDCDFTNKSYYNFKGFKIATSAAATKDASWITSTGNISATSGGSGGCTYISGCPYYFISSLTTSGTVYAVYELRSYTLTVTADSHSWAKVYRTSSPIGASTSTITQLADTLSSTSSIGSTATIYEGDVLEYVYDSDGCLGTGYDYIMNTHTVDGTTRNSLNPDATSRYSWTVSGNSTVAVTSKDQSKVLTVHYRDISDSSTAIRADDTIRVCKDAAAEKERPSISGYNFVGWKQQSWDGYASTFCTNAETSCGKNGAATLSNNTVQKTDITNTTYAFDKYKRNVMSSDREVYAVYARKYTLTVTADNHSWTKVYRTSSPYARSSRSSTAPLAERANTTVSTTAVIYAGDVLEYEYDADGCLPSGYDYIMNGHTVDGTTRNSLNPDATSRYSWTISGNSAVVVNSQDRSKVLTGKHYDTDGNALSLSDVTDRVCLNDTAHITRRPNPTGYAFVGWKSKLDSDVYLNRVTEQTTGYWLSGSTLNSANPLINRSYGTYNYANMTSDLTRYAIYVRQYNLTISTDTCSSATVSRTSSDYAATGVLANGAKIYAGDILSVTFGKDSSCTCFDLRIHSINDDNDSYGTGTYSYTVLGDTTVVANSHLRQYTLTKRQATGTTVTVKRTDSPNTAAGVVAYKVADGTVRTLTGKASISNLSNNAAIYCGDVLNTNFKLNTGYSWGEYGHSEKGWHFQGLGVNEWGPNNDLNEEKNFNDHVVDLDVTAETLAVPDGGTVVRNEFQGRATVNEQEYDKRSDTTGWVETNTQVDVTDAKCLNYAMSGETGCKVKFNLDLKNIHGTGTTYYTVYKTRNGSRTKVYPATATSLPFRKNGEDNIYEKEETIYPGETMCYDVEFYPFGYNADGTVRNNNTKAYARACVTAQVSNFEGKTTITSTSGTTANGYTNETNSTRITHNISNCPITGCNVTFVHDLKRTQGIGWTNYRIDRTSNYPDGTTSFPGISNTKLADGTEYFQSSTGGVLTNPVEREEYRETITLYPGVVVCETLKFMPENNYRVHGAAQAATNGITLTTCASAQGDAQPDDPEDTPDEPSVPDDPRIPTDPTPVDPDGPISDVPGGDNALLNIKVTNNSLARYQDSEGNPIYAKVVYAKPGDNLTYRATYNPLLQYTYFIKPEAMQIDGGTTYTNSYITNPGTVKTSSWYLGYTNATHPTSMFNYYKNSGTNNGRGLKNWNNDFSVYSTNFNKGSSGSQFQAAYSHTNGDTSFQAHTNDHKALMSEVGTSLVEFARTNYDLTGKTTVQTTPSQVRFNNNGGAEQYNKANVITTGLSRSAFARIPYNFNTKIDDPSDEPTCANADGTVCAGEEETIKFPIEVTPKTNCATTNNCAITDPDDPDYEGYRTNIPEARKQVIVYDPAGVNNSRLNGTDNWGSSKNDSDNNGLCRYFGLTTSDETKCGYAKLPDGTNDKAISTAGETISATFYTQDKPAGSRICVAVALYPSYSGADTNWADPEGSHTWRISKSTCYTIAKKPSFQAWGGNVYAAGKINTAANKKAYVAGYTDSNYKVANGSSDGYYIFGSWGELGVIAGGAINEFGSAATMGYALNNGGNLLPNPLNKTYNTRASVGDNPGGYYAETNARAGICFRSLLTFANANDSGTCTTGTGGSVGNLGSTATSSHATTDKSAIIARFNDVETESLKDTYPDGNLGSFINDVTGMHYYEYSGSATMGENTLRKSTDGADETDASDVATIFLKVNGTLTINGNIRYAEGWKSAATYTSITDIPKLIIYATGDINISCNVTEIDAMLVSDGTVDTCSDGAKDEDGRPNYNMPEYSKQLIINGAIIASRVNFNRTYGAATGANSIVPAEILNYDPTLYLWGSSQADMSTTGSLTVTYTMELSPRYGE